jgi:homoserine kinase
LSEIDEGLSFHITGEGADDLPRDSSNLVVKGAQAVFQAVGRAPSGLGVRIHSEIPLSSGLGSSATALLGGTVAANALVDYPLAREDLLKITARLEGHPDNVTAALLGGLVISSHGDDGIVYRSVPIQPLQVIVVLPEVRLSTGAARDALPKEVPLKDAAQNVGRAALVVQALIHGDFGLLGEAMRDRLHEPYRRKLIPGIAEVEKAARDKGAATVALSGAGPAVVAFAEDPETYDAITRAMAETFQKMTNKPARTWLLPIDTQGIAISEMATDLPLTRKRKPAASPPPESELEEKPPTVSEQKTEDAPTQPERDAKSEEEAESEAARPLGLGEAAELLRQQSGADEEQSKPESA